MKKCVFNAKTMGPSVPDEPHQTSIRLVDEHGQELTLGLSQSARLSLIERLITRPPSGVSGQASGSGVRFKAQVLALVERNGEAVLEIQIGPQQSIHIALQGTQSETLMEELHQHHKSCAAATLH